MSGNNRRKQNVVIDNNLCQGRHLVISADVVSSPRNKVEHAMDVRLKRRRAGRNRAIEGDSSAGPAPVALDQTEKLKLGTLRSEERRVGKGESAQRRAYVE